jgi:hypothetical protein
MVDANAHRGSYSDSGRPNSHFGGEQLYQSLSSMGDSSDTASSSATMIRGPLTTPNPSLNPATPATRAQRRPSNVQQRRPSAAASHPSRLPRAAASSSGSSAAGSSIDDRSDVPPISPSVRQHNPTSGQFDVILSFGRIERMVELDLNATGEAFFNTLRGHFRNLRRNSLLDLDRTVDRVVFAIHRDPGVDDDCCQVDLVERRMPKTWAHAVGWIRGVLDGLDSEDSIYAIIERHGG